MMISRAEVALAISAYRGPSAPARAALPSTPREVITLARFRQVLDAIPPERTERLQPLRQAIEGGGYHVPATEIVDKLLARLVVEALV